MKRIALSVVAVAVAAILPLSAADAQRGRRGAQDGPRLRNAEQLLGMRDRLELSDEQVAQLEELRVAALERRQAQQAEMQDLRSRMRAGDLERGESRDLMAERREANRAAGEQHHERVNAILTDVQQERLNTLRAERAGPRRGVRRGATRGGRSAHRGFRGSRFDRAPVQGRRGARALPCRGRGCRPVR